jgi:Ser/Thr protein kinase RdoA (MazF antagonist)
VIHGVQFAARLATQLFWLGRDQLLAPLVARSDAIPNAVESITVPWLREALSQFESGALIESCEMLGGHSGTTTRERIRLDFSGGAHPGDLPEALFVKITPESFGTKVFAALFGLGRSEVGFYNQIAADVPIPIPRSYCARSARHGGRFIILLEDLEARGCEFPTGDLDLAQARAVIQCLGRLHGGFWESPRFAGDLAWLRCHENRDNIGVEHLMSRRANAPSIERYPDELSADVRERSPKIHEHREILEAYWSDGPRTLIHGDCHRGNLFFDGDEVGYFDWQIVQRGQGIRDVSYFMTNSLTTELRRSAEAELIDLYLETLREAGVSGLGVDRAWVFERYRAHSLYAWISSSVTAATPGLQPVEVARAAMQRSGAALDDHAALDLLDEIVKR